MRNTLKRITLIGMVFLISLSLASLALAAPPGLAKKKANSEIQQVKEEIKLVPQGLQAKGTPPGLVNKGGLPPGMHGRSLDELPPGIRNNPNFQEAIEILKEKEKEKEQEIKFTLTVAGSEFIIIPDEDFVTATYTAFLKDADDSAEAVAATWKLKDAPAGVSIDEDDGVLKVTASANAGTITVIADYTTGEGDAKKEHSGSLAVELYKQVISEIEISGKEFFTLKGDEEGPLRFEYTAKVLDQKGKVIVGESVTWSTSSTDYTGITIINVNGSFIIEIPATEGKFTVKATSGTVEKTLLVTIYNQNIASITIVGPKFVPLNGDSTLPALEYSAIVKDQKGRVMEGKSVSWSTSSANTHSFTVNGTMILNLPATEGAYTVTATSGEVSGTLVVTVYTPTVTSIEIKGDKFVTLQEDDTELSLAYAAIVRDQKNQVMENIVLKWSATTDTDFVLENGEITLTELPAPGDEIEFTLTADYMKGNEVLKRGILTVIVYHPVVDDIRITGAATITVPTAGSVSAAYNAVILDQQEQTIEAEIEWLLTDVNGAEVAVSGVALDNGTLTVTSGAAKGYVWLWVVYDEDIYASFMVNIV